MFMINILVAAAVLAPAPVDDGIAWFEGGYNSAVKAAKADDKLILIAFVPEWSDYSTKVVEETFPDPGVAAEMADLICLQYRNDDSQASQVMRLYNVEQFPSIVVAGSDGKIEELISGYIPAGPLVEQLQRIKAGDNTVGFWRDQAEADPENMSLVYQLASKLQSVGDVRRAEKEIQKIRRSDPEGETVLGARVIMDEVWAQAESSSDGAVDLSVITERIDSLSLPAARFEAWNKIGNYHAGNGNMEGSRDAFITAGQFVPEDARLGWGRDIVWFFAEGAETGISDEHRAFALQTARGVVEQAEALADPAVREAQAFEVDDYDSWLAAQLDTLAWATFRLGDEEDATRMETALALAERCVALDPENEEYRGRMELFKARM